MRQKKPAPIRWEPPIQIKKEFTGKVMFGGVDPGHARMGISIDEYEKPDSFALTYLLGWLLNHFGHIPTHTPLVLGIEWFGNWGQMKQAKSAAAEAIRCVKDYWRAPVIVCKVWPQYWHRKIFKGSRPGAGIGQDCGDWKELSQMYCDNVLNLPGLSTDAAEAHLIRKCVKTEFEQRLLLKGADK